MSSQLFGTIAVYIMGELFDKKIKNLGKKNFL